MSTPAGLTAAETPYDLLRAALVADPARPALTYRDEASGERTELSLTTLDNWVAKTANLLQEGLDAGPGTRVALSLPLHWQHMVWLLGCWAAGAVVVEQKVDADVVVTTGEEAAAVDAPDVVALALRPLAVPGAGVPPGVLDYDVEIRAYGDVFTPWQPVTSASEALDAQIPVGTTAAPFRPGPHVVPGGALVAAARSVAEAGALGPGDRVLVDAMPSTWALAMLTLAPLAAGAAVLLLSPQAQPDADALTRIAGTEQVTHRWREHGLLRHEHG